MALLKLVKDAEALREVLTNLVLVAAQDVSTLTREVEASTRSKEIVAEALKQSLPELLLRYLMGAATVTADWYDDLVPRSRYEAFIPEIDFDERLRKSAKWAVYAPGAGTVENRLIGVAQRSVFDASRTTVVENAKAERVRYARLAQPDACDFCKVLALRGAVYHSEDKASAGHTIDASHDKCYCEIVPVRTGKWRPPAYYKEFDKEYTDATRELKDNGVEKPNLKQVLAKMREQASGVPVELGSTAPVFDTAGWSPERAKIRKALTEAKTLPELQKIAEDLLGPRLDGQLGLVNRLHGGKPRIIIDPAVHQATAAIGPPLEAASVDNVRASIRAVDDVMAKYPDIKLGGLTFMVDPKDSVYASTYPIDILDFNSGSAVVNMNGGWVNRSKSVDIRDSSGKIVYRPSFDEAYASDVTNRWHPAGVSTMGLDRAAYDIGVHEMGHGMAWSSKVANAGAEDVAWVALQDYFTQTRGSSVTRAQFDEWLAGKRTGGGLTRYAFDKDGVLDVTEALAEAFADVEINGGSATEPSKVLHKILVDYYNGKPYEAMKFRWERFVG